MNVINCWTDAELKDNLGMSQGEIETFKKITDEKLAQEWLAKRLVAIKKSINRVCLKCGTYCYGDCKS